MTEEWKHSLEQKVIYFLHLSMRLRLLLIWYWISECILLLDLGLDKQELVWRSITPLIIWRQWWIANQGFVSFWEVWTSTIQTVSRKVWTSPTEERERRTLPGAGKRRLLIIGNYIVQRLLYPVHSWAMGVLSRLPCDGTFEQEAPIRRLSHYYPMNVSSFDLSSATDRWPVAFITRVMSLIFGNMAGEWIVLGTLSNNVFSAGPPLWTRLLYFKTGQPLGYYGSWALFSLSHHVLVWMAARVEYPWETQPFTRYALLGDYIVIADKRVAKRYRLLVNMLGLSISESKSIDSPIGALEFAKQFWMYRVQVNLTPLSAKA